mgnify:CR=1 FL=1
MSSGTNITSTDTPAREGISLRALALDSLSRYWPKGRPAIESLPLPAGEQPPLVRTSPAWITAIMKLADLPLPMPPVRPMRLNAGCCICPAVYKKA